MNTERDGTLPNANREPLGLHSLAYYRNIGLRTECILAGSTLVCYASVMVPVRPVTRDTGRHGLIFLTRAGSPAF